MTAIIFGNLRLKLSVVVRFCSNNHLIEIPTSKYSAENSEKTVNSNHRHYEQLNKCIFSKTEHKVHIPYVTQFSHLKVNMSIVCAHSLNATSFFRAGFYVTSSNVTRER